MTSDDAAIMCRSLQQMMEMVAGAKVTHNRYLSQAWRAAKRNLLGALGAAIVAARAAEPILPPPAPAADWDSNIPAYPDIGQASRIAEQQEEDSEHDD